MTKDIKRNAQTIAATYSLHVARAIALMAAVVAISLFLYGFFLLEAVAHTASRAEAQGQIQTLTSKLSSLEQQYLADTSSMTLEKAHALGFVAPTQLAIVYAQPTSPTLTMRVQY